MFEWREQYSVGVREIDEQHKKLFALISKLHDAIKAGRAPEITVETLAGVVDYAKEHFATEEVLMRIFDYPEYIEHKQIHDSLMAQTDALVVEAKNRSLAVSMQLSHFLEVWIKHHVSGTDQKLGKFLQNKGAR